MLCHCVPYHDWNNDGKRDSGDEWIELYNGSNQPADLSGWQLDDGKHGSAPYTIPAGTTLAPQAFLVFYGSETNIGLNNGGDTVRLLHPDGTIADKKQYDPIATNASYARAPDGGDTWVTDCPPTPGITNCPPAATPTLTRTFTLTDLATARTMPVGSRVSVLGSVIAQPCELDPFGHELTLSDGAAGMDVFLAYPERFSCTMPRGEQIVVTGVLSDHLGLRTLYPHSNLDVVPHYMPALEIAPLLLHTGKLGERTESMLVTIQGKVSNGKNGDVIWVNDGTGMAQVYADAASGASFQGITRGSIVRITGIGYQSNARGLPNEGYSIRPRTPDDVVLLKRAEKLPNAPGKHGGVDLGAVSIEQALATHTQNYVTVGGVVTVPPGVISAREFWIQDANSGAHIYIAASAGTPPSLPLYANVSVRGRVVSELGAREIRVELLDAIGVYGAGATVAPRLISTGQKNFSNEGLLVTIQGRITRISGRDIYVDDGSGEVLTYIDANTKIHYPKLNPGDPARITGVLARFRGKVQVLPRYQSDVQFGFMLLPIAGGAGLQNLYALGGSGVRVNNLQGIAGDAASQVAHSPSLMLPKTALAVPRVSNPKPTSGDPLAVASFLLLSASGIFGTIAVCKYRNTVRRVEQGGAHSAMQFNDVNSSSSGLDSREPSIK